MLIICSECKREMSDTLVACPHCGYAHKNEEFSTKAISVPKKRTATFQFISLAAAAVAILTPMILLAIPCLLVISAGIIALIRREPRWAISLLSIIFGFFLIGSSGVSSNGNSDYLSNMQIASWDWTQEDNYSYVKGRVTNNGSSTVSYFSVTAQYKDATGQVLDTDFTNSGQDMGPGESKEFEIMHEVSPEYVSVSVSVDQVRTK